MVRVRTDFERFVIWYLRRGERTDKQEGREVGKGRVIFKRLPTATPKGQPVRGMWDFYRTKHLPP